MTKIFFTLNADQVKIVWAESAGLDAAESTNIIFEWERESFNLADVSQHLRPHLTDAAIISFVASMKRAIELSNRIDPIRDESIKIRLTKKEKDTLAERAGAMSAAAYLRHCGIYTPPVSIPTINAETLTELRRIGTNLNQIARHSNETLSADILTATTEIAALRLALVTAQK